MSQVTACALNPAEQPFEKHKFLLGLVPLTANAKLSQNENVKKNSPQFNCNIACGVSHTKGISIGAFTLLWQRNADLQCKLQLMWNKSQSFFFLIQLMKPSGSYDPAPGYLFADTSAVN
jgi:hypothetical protein